MRELMMDLVNDVKYPDRVLVHLRRVPGLWLVVDEQLAEAEKAMSEHVERTDSPRYDPDIG
jgi:hypothetical protein